MYWYRYWYLLVEYLIQECYTVAFLVRREGSLIVINARL